MSTIPRWYASFDAVKESPSLSFFSSRFHSIPLSRFYSRRKSYPRREEEKKEHRNIVTTERDEKIEADEGKHEKGVFETKCIIEYRDDAHQALPEKVAAREWGRLESFEG